MFTAEERLRLIHVKIERANKHISDLRTEIHAFLGSRPYEVGAKPDAKIPDKVVKYFISVQETPVIISAVAGDALFNLRAALDHLAYQLGSVNGASDRILRLTCFPISDNAEKYKTEAPGKVRGMSTAA